MAGKIARLGFLAGLGFLSFFSAARGQPVPTTTPSDRWSFSISALTYVVEDGRDYVSPVIAADRDWLHLEARYNYEALDTGSVFVGCNFELGDTLVLEFTPMIGGVFGDTNGVAPGYRFSLAWRRLEFYGEGEYLFDAEGSSDNYFYVWNELSYSLTDWFRFGLAAQRTRAYESDLEIQPGLLLGVTWKQLDFAAYAFNMGLDDPVFVFSIGVDF